MKQSLPIYRLLFLLLFSAALNGGFAQQANTYVYSYTTTTTDFNYLGTNLETLVSGVSSWDDNVYTNVPIGFTFYFEGLPYTTVGVSSNGFIWFGTGTASTTEYNPISDASIGTGTINGVVAAYGANLLAYPQTLQSAQTGVPSISYADTSSGCSRQFIVQWKGAYVSGTTTGEETGDLHRVDLQIVLNETTNEITIYVRTDPYPYYESSSGEVGIRGASNTDFESLTCWTAGCAQTTNNAAQATNNPRYPANKSAFNFTPPACSFTATTSSTNASCGNNGTITITVTNGTGVFAYIINNGVTADTNLTGQFTGLSAGTYTTAAGNGICEVGSCATITSSTTTPTASNNGPTCLGGSVTLSTGTVAGATYSWTGPNGYSSSSQNPVINNITAADSGTYTIVDTVGGCASAAATTHVSISGAAVPPQPGSNSPICAGTTLDLADTVSGATYSWTGPNGYTSTSQNPTITNTTLADTGTYTVVNTLGGCASSPATVHVVINPTPPTPKVSNNGPLCAGSNLLLMDSTSGATYNWTGPNSYSSHSQNPTIDGVVVADSGNYSVVDTIAGCASPSATTHVSIVPSLTAPVLSSNSPVCLGDTLKISSSSVGFTYAWTGPNGFTSASQNPVLPDVAYTDSGYYKVIVTSGSCSTGPDSIRISVNALPSTPVASSNSPICSGDSLKLSSSLIAGVAYNWTGPSAFSSSLQNPVITNTPTADAGIYTVFATLNGCNSDTSTINVVVNPTPATPSASSNSPVCSGDTIKLVATDATNGASYTWTGPISFNSPQQNPFISNSTTADSGTYTVVAGIGSCNSPSASVHVTVSVTPSTPVASSNSPVCTGQQLDLNASSTAGANFSWSGPTSFSDTAQNPTIPSASSGNSGTYIVIAIIGNCSSAPDSIAVSVGSTPALTGVTSNSPVCSGDTLKLSAPSVTGATYSWTGPDGFSDTTQYPAIDSIAANGAGDYMVVAHFANCSSAPDTVNVVVKPLPAPVITAYPDTICSNDSSHLCVTGGYVHYRWNGLTDTSQCVYVNSAGNYNVIVTDQNGCTAQSSKSNSANVSVYPVPNVSIIENGDTLSTYGETGYQWYRNDTLIPAATGSTYVVPVTGAYSVEITDGNGCTAISSQVSVTVTSAGINEVNAAFNLSIYPNPASGSFNIIYSGTNDKNVQLNIYNILGQNVMQENLSFSNGKNKTIDISDFPKGVYLLQFAQQGGPSLTKKLVVQ